MEQFCNKCGERLPERVAFCSKCGNQVDTPNVQSVLSEAKADNNTGNNKGIIKVIVAIVAVVALILVVKQIIGGSNNSPEAPVKSFMKGLMNGDMDKVFQSFPDEMLSELSSSAKKELKSQMKEFESYFKEIKYKVTDSKELGVDDLEELQYEFEDYFKVKKAYNVEVEITAEMLDQEYTDTLDFTVVKIGTKYYVVNSDIF